MPRLLLAALLSLAAACGSDPSCAVTGTGDELLSCIELGGAIPENDAKESCESNGGEWRDDPCDDRTAVARCDLFGSSTWYYQPFLDQTGSTLADLRMSCEETGGTFEELAPAST
jgi:hypothetical protein